MVFDWIGRENELDGAKHTGSVGSCFSCFTSSVSSSPSFSRYPNVSKAGKVIDFIDPSVSEKLLCNLSLSSLTFSSRANLFAMDLSSSAKSTVSTLRGRRRGGGLARIICFVAVLLALVESIVLLFLINLRLGYSLLVAGLIDLAVANVGLSTHFEKIRLCSRRIRSMQFLFV